MKKLVEVRVKDFWLIEGELMIQLEIKVPGHVGKIKTMKYNTTRNEK